MSSFYKMDPAAWDFGTAELTLEQEAAYLRVVNAIHKHDAPVPNNDRVLAGLFRTSTRKARALVSDLIEAGKLVLEDDRIWNERARSDMVQRGFVSGSMAENGARGGRKRAENAAKALKDNDTHQATASSRIEENRIEDKEEDTNVSSVVSLPDGVADCLAHFNATAERVGWPQVQKFSKPRRAALSQRIKDVGGVENWCEAIVRAAHSPLLTGQTGNGWKADFDWLAKPANFTKLLEGNYDQRNQNNSAAARPGANRATENLMAGFAAVAARHSGPTQ